MSKKFLFVLGIMGIGLSVTSVAVPVKTEVIRFASGVYPPFTMLENNRVLCGFDIDIAKALCEKIGAKCVFSQDKFSNMESTLRKNKYDAWINAISITDNHQENISFTKPYLASKAVLIATKNTVFNAAPIEIKGRTIGVADHTCYIHYLKNTYGNIINIKVFPTEEDSFAALEKGLVDAVIDDAIALKQRRLAQNDKQKYRLIGLPAKYADLVWHQYGIAVAKDKLDLVKKFNNAIDCIKSDGTYTNLEKKYFSN